MQDSWSDHRRFGWAKLVGGHRGRARRGVSAEAEGRERSLRVCKQSHRNVRYSIIFGLNETA